MSFPNIDCSKRTNSSFRNRDQKEHHKEYRSAIENLPNVDLVADFPTSDPLHLLELGITKKCLSRWVNGTKSYKKLKTVDLKRLNSLSVQLNPEAPTEMHRGVRDLSNLHFWKGVEFRSFLLYTGIVVLKNIVSVQEYDHFKILSCATKLCSSDAYSNLIQNTELLDILVKEYIKEYKNIYGNHTMSSNVHNLCHLPDDVRRFGNLNSISTYPFENCLYTIKLKLRAMAKPLEQISRRISEISFLANYESNSQFNISSNQFPQLKSPIPNDKSKYRVVLFENYRLSSLKIGDKWLIDKNRRIMEFKYALISADNKIILHGYEVKKKIDFFSSPFSSSKIDIYQVFIDENDEQLELEIEIADIKCKMLCFSFESSFVFQPLLHTLQH